MLKKDLRLKYSLLRNEITSQLLLHSSLTIANKVLELPIWQYNYYHLYLPISSKKEIDTSFILSILQGKDKEVVLPKIDIQSTSLINILLTDNTKLIINNWGIPEPIDGIEVSTEKIDLVFIPLLAFDLKGNRVGYGKGFYDRFLSKCRKDVVKIGLSTFSPEIEIDDSNMHDIALDYCVTPEKIYTF